MDDNHQLMIQLTDDKSNVHCEENCINSRLNVTATAVLNGLLWDVPFPNSKQFGKSLQLEDWALHLPCCVMLVSFGIRVKCKSTVKFYPFATFYKLKKKKKKIKSS